MITDWYVNTCTLNIGNFDFTKYSTFFVIYTIHATTNEFKNSKQTKTKQQ